MRTSQCQLLTRMKNCKTSLQVTVQSENKGLELNAKKTECMIISKQTDIHVCNFLCKGERIKQVGTFKYLGFTVTSDVRCDTVIKKRLPFFEDTLTKMKFMLTNRNDRIYTKIITLKAYTLSILLYGCECWTLTKDLERRLEAADIWYIRRRMRISWTEKK